jgi:hypothetical protein
VSGDDLHLRGRTSGSSLRDTLTVRVCLNGAVSAEVAHHASGVWGPATGADQRDLKSSDKIKESEVGEKGLTAWHKLTLDSHCQSAWPTGDESINLPDLICHQESCCLARQISPGWRYCSPSACRAVSCPLLSNDPALTLMGYSLVLASGTGGGDSGEGGACPRAGPGAARRRRCANRPERRGQGQGCESAGWVASCFRKEITVCLWRRASLA